MTQSQFDETSIDDIAKFSFFKNELMHTLIFKCHRKKPPEGAS